IFGTLALVGLVGLVASVGVFAVFSQGLPPTTDLENIQFLSESVVYDRSGSVELARFNAGEAREPVTFDQIPPILMDAMTAVEDKSFWTNSGIDPLGILSATLDTIRGRDRGASTITQQLVRQRLLDPELVRDPDRVIERKVKEIIQSVRVTEAYPGQEGKRRIMEAYVNQNYYGNGSYGVLAAAKGYFGVASLDELTLGQVALLAALPQSPSTHDLVRNAEVAADGTLFVPLDTGLPIVERRNYILNLMADEPDRMVLTGGQYTEEQLRGATVEPIILAPQVSRPGQQWLAPHFIWSLRDELATKLCGPDADTCPALEQGGLRVTSSLDYDLQQVAEKWVTAGVILPHDADPEAYAQTLGVPYENWMKKLRNLEVNNGAMIALDYQTGEILAYVGSAGYYRGDLESPQFQPQFDVLGDGWRQPGSAFKPFNYVTGINDGVMTAATMFMDVTTTFDNSSGYTPTDYDLLERGPTRMRAALQWSLNIPAVKAQVINGVDHVFQMAQAFGMTFQGQSPRAALSLTLGTEVTHMRDVAVSYGTLANEGRHIGYTHVLRIADASGVDLVDPYVPPLGEAVVSPQAAYVMTNILDSNTRPAQNPIWGDFELENAGGQHRPATLKTGTSNDANDLVAFGYVAPPDEAGRAAGEYALVVGAWSGNSDGSPVLTPENPVLSTDVAAPLWRGFMREVTTDWPVRDFVRPPGVSEADVDAWSGGTPTQFTRETVREVFIDGTVPGPDTTKVGLQVVLNPLLPPDAPNPYVLWVEGCAGIPETRGFLALETVEPGHPDWQRANLDWINRAKQGPGTDGGPNPETKTETSYLFSRNYTPWGKSWGAPFAPTESCIGLPSPSPSMSESPSISPSFSFTPAPTITPEPTPIPTDVPTLPPTDAPTLPPIITPPPPTDPPPTDPPPTAPPDTPSPAPT
ncbi:MAG: transglycosylase domain-containing protein, partial [Chloroflexota bacterium]